ncbi:hypothetical protein GIB67_029838 [Kingdonia uniflora]|uniref:ABC transmembrane type-1 domain-containing protein n=1 Tax=Kingdonia uniflora TaxID=39325 RepID=A0A7J7NJL9_9MAGN|nr:hypothetical protein GIB67_029838 [Kingdonia uniflora]
MEEKAKEVPISQLVYLNKPEIPVILLGVISAAINGVVFPIFGILLSGIVKLYYEPSSELRKYSKLRALMFVILGLVVNMEISWFDEPRHSSGAIGARLSSDSATVRGLVGDTLALYVRNMEATATAGLVIAFTASWELAFIILGLLLLVGVNACANEVHKRIQYQC